jgi:hypothetical protein
VRQRTLWEPEPKQFKPYARHTHNWLATDAWLSEPWNFEKVQMQCEVCGAERLPPLTWRFILGCFSFFIGVILAILLHSFWFWVGGYGFSCVFTELNERFERRWMNAHIREVLSR